MFCPYSVRQARRNDIPSIVALWQQMMAVHQALDGRFRLVADADVEFARHARRMMQAAGSRIFVAEMGAHVIGYVLAEMQQRPPIYPAGRYGFISDLCVAEPFRRRGIGRALAQRAIGWLQSEGATAVELLASDRNQTAREFWAAMGFEPYLVMLRRESDAHSPARIGFRIV